MGQGKSKINNRPLFEPSEFEVLSKIVDSRYGDMRPIVHKETKVAYAGLTRTIQNEEEFAHHVGELEIRQQIIHPQIVRLANYNSKKTDEFCSTFYTVGLLYEYFANNLQTEIAEREKYRVAYREGEIWYILDSLLNAVNYLQQQNITHGDIRPYNVILTQNGEIKLGEVFKHKGSLSGFSQILNQQLNELYLSPQYFAALNNYQGEPVLDRFKAEVYSIGMTALEAATLQNVSNLCYDTENFTIRSDQVNILLNQVRSQFSYQLYDFLSKLLEENDANRKTASELLVELNQSFALSQKANNLTLIELFSQRESEQIQYNNYEEPEEKVVRAGRPQQQETTDLQSSVTAIITANDDLNARIQAVIALSRETIAKYGVPIPQSTANSTFVQQQQQQPISNDSRASQVQTRTFLNSNTNNIETKTLSGTIPAQQDSIEEVIKRATRNYDSRVVSNEPTIRQSQFNQPIVEEKNYAYSSTYAPAANTTSTYSPLGLTFGSTGYQASDVSGANNNYGTYTNTYVPSVSSTYVPSASTTYGTSQNYYASPLQNNNGTVTTGNQNFQTPEEREAYINRIISDVKKSTTSFPATQQQGNTQITYTNVIY